MVTGTCAGSSTTGCCTPPTAWSTGPCARTFRRSLTTRDFTADADWAQQYAEQLDRAVAAWADPAVWDGEVDLGGSASPAAEIAAMLIEETALHGWDVARAVGEEFRLSDEAAAYVLGVVDSTAALYRQYDGFADEVTVPASASVFERALAHSGRDPHWTGAA